MSLFSFIRFRASSSGWERILPPSQVKIFIRLRNLWFVRHSWMSKLDQWISKWGAKSLKLSFLKIGHMQASHWVWRLLATAYKSALDIILSTLLGLHLSCPENFSIISVMHKLEMSSEKCFFKFVIVTLSSVNLVIQVMNRWMLRCCIFLLYYQESIILWAVWCISGKC